MSKHTKLTLVGTGHWSIRGKLESNMWIWWIEIEGVQISDEETKVHMLQKDQGVAFIRELRPYLPVHLQQSDLVDDGKHVSMPSHIPGGNWDLQLPLSECIELEAAEHVIEKYFAGLYSMA